MRWNYKIDCTTISYGHGRLGIKDINIDPFQPLETERLRLRCVAPGDAASITRLITPKISQWLAAWPSPFTPRMALARIATARKIAFAGNAVPFSVFEKQSAELIGWAAIYRDSMDHGRGAFGYWLGEAYHGKGYMTELAPIALAGAFKILNLNVIEAGAQLENTASFAVMRSCGMKPAGQKMVHAPTRKRDELCQFYERQRPTHD